MSKAKVFGFFLLFLILLGFFQYLVVSHEEIHRIIFERDGCDEIVVDIGLWSGSTRCADKYYISSSWSLQTHAIHESISYNFIGLMFFIAILFAMFIVLGCKVEGGV